MFAIFTADPSYYRDILNQFYQGEKSTLLANLFEFEFLGETIRIRHKELTLGGENKYVNLTHQC